MFTIAQIKSAHAKVKSGADFPGYIRDIISLGVIRYETFVSDNHTDYFSEEGFETASPGLIPALIVSTRSDADEFLRRLKKHQAGETSYPTFRNDCAETGIDRWIVEMKTLTCTYFDLSGTKILVEKIPV